ncbi:Phosphoadenylyl-sulfate reductase (thioredoxin) [Prochlorococcus sp. MIT 0601]|nr:Phosphoadenylyl-sulfate reductase (thioredoxin) [Prochlorococcus sp. MIT 0601]
MKIPLSEAQEHLKSISPRHRLEWAYEQFGDKLAITTSFGIQSAVLLHMLYKLDKKDIKIIWVDTGYLPPETYQYAELLSNKLNLDISVAQSNISPARMEAIYGQLWKNNSKEDLEKYHLIRKINPLEETLTDLNIHCWASGVRKNQTDTRRSMNVLDKIRGRLSLRPILEWTTKDIFYYMKENELPQHPLFAKGYSTVGDSHSSGPDGNEGIGRETRFGGLKQECGIHLENQEKESQK